MSGIVASIGIKAIAGAAVSKAASGAKGVGKWIGSLDLVHLCLLAVSLFAAWQTVGRWAQHRHTVKVEAQLGKCTEAREKDAATYAKAQADAAAKNRADVAADKAERERITHNVSQSYEAQLVSLRADLARRLQQIHAAAPQGAPVSAGLPDVSAAPSGPDDAARVSIPTGLYVRGAELELKLERLQQWITEQMKVDPNKAPSK